LKRFLFIICNKKYQELLELVISGVSLPKGSTEEEKKTFDELLSDHENMKEEANDLGISEPIIYIPSRTFIMDHLIREEFFDKPQFHSLI